MNESRLIKIDQELTKLQDSQDCNLSCIGCPAEVPCLSLNQEWWRLENERRAAVAKWRTVDAKKEDSPA